MNINGSTRIFITIGNPINLVKSPELFNQHFINNNINAIMIALDISSEELSQFWAGIKCANNIDGIVVTMPHKRAMARNLDCLMDNASITNSVNIIKRTGKKWIGEIFDGEGCVKALSKNGVTIYDKKIALFGIGGAGEAIAVALARANCKELFIHDTDLTKINYCKELLKINFPNVEVKSFSGFNTGLDVFINATSIGMSDDDSPIINVNDLPAGAFVFDVITKDTALIKSAKMRGLRASNGIDMHREQAKLAIEFLDLPPL